MARPPLIARDDGPTQDGAQLVPVDLDARVVEVQRRLAQAGAHAEAAEGRVTALRRVLMAADTAELARLQAQHEIDDAERAARTAAIAREQVRGEAREVRATVLRELRAALAPRVQAAAMAMQAAMERVRDTEHAALLAVLEDVLRFTGSGDPRAMDLVWQVFIPSNGADDQVTARRRYLAREVRWSD